MTPTARERPTVAILALLTAVVGGGFLLSLGVGAAPIAPGDVWAAVTGRGDPVDTAIITGLRLPRALLALLAGGALALSGAVFQALLRNPLAEPYILGVAGGAALGATWMLSAGGVLSGFWPVQGAAFAGALMATLVVLRIARSAGPTLDPRVFLLAGVVVGALFNAVVTLVLASSDAEASRSILFWMMGSLSGASAEGVLLLALWTFPALAGLLAMARSLDLLAAGEEMAFHLGVPVERLRRLAYLITSVLVGGVVASCGVIGFVGLVVPHALRLVGGSGHRFLLPASLLAGGGFLLLSDTLARTLMAPAELPVGVVTALFGVPAFLFLLLRGRR